MYVSPFALDPELNTFCNRSASITVVRDCKDVSCEETNSKAISQPYILIERNELTIGQSKLTLLNISLETIAKAQ